MSPPKGKGHSRGPDASSQIFSMMLQGRSFSGRERNCCFLNTLADPAAKGRFANVSATSGLDFADDGRTVSVVDWDHDGDLDLWISNRNAPRIRLLRNNTNSGNHFLAVRLAGNGKTTSVDAIGARVEVTTTGEGKPQIKTLRAGEGYLAQSSKWLHFGLGTADEIEKVIVHWPGGEQETFTGLDVDGRYRLVQGSGKAVDRKQSRGDLVLRPSTQKLPPKASTARIPLVSRFLLPKGSYQGLDGSRQPLPLGRGGLLINLWSASCRPCLAELAEFTQRETEIRAAGVEIVALSVDQLADDPADPIAVTNLVSKLAFPFSAGFTSPELLKLLQMFHDEIVPIGKPLPLPSSFLLDAKGRLTVIYKGPVSVDQLLADARHEGGTLFKRQRRAALLPGRLLEDETLIRLAHMEQFRQLLDMVEGLQKAGRVFDVVALYEDALRIGPDNAEIHNNLGGTLQRLGRFKEAIPHFKEALRIKPELAGAHNNWGIALENLERFKEAVTHYQEAVRIEPDYAKAHYNLGIVLHKMGRDPESIVHYKEAIRIEPDHAQAHNNCGTVLHALGRIEEAVEYYRRAVRINPGFAMADNNCGIALCELGRLEEAMAHYRSALQVKPNFANAHNNCGAVLRSLGNFKEALTHYRKAVRLNPNFAKAHNNLAWLLATCPDKTIRDGRQALAHAERARQLFGDKVYAIQESLAAAHAELGDFDEAVRSQERAAQFAPEAEKEKSAARLKLYMQGKPYRDLK
jgi:tetratricopeptide (TPR) repeat protein/peroxiredoxin